MSQASLGDFEGDAGQEEDRLEELTDAEREVYLAVERGKIGPREYARRTDRVPGTVGNLLARAREKLDVDEDDDRDVATDGGQVNDGRPAFIDPQTEWVTCWFCGRTLDPEIAEGIDVSDEDEYYPRMKPICPTHGGEDDEQ